MNTVRRLESRHPLSFARSVAPTPLQIIEDPHIMFSLRDLMPTW